MNIYHRSKCLHAGLVPLRAPAKLSMSSPVKSVNASPFKTARMYCAAVCVFMLLLLLTHTGVHAQTDPNHPPHATPPHQPTTHRSLRGHDASVATWHPGRHSYHHTSSATSSLPAPSAGAQKGAPLSPQPQMPSLKSELARLANRKWQPIPPLLLDQVFFTSTERTIVGCLDSNRSATVETCAQQNGIYAKKGKSNGNPAHDPVWGIPFAGPLGKGSHVCPHLKMATVGRYWVDDNGGSPSLDRSHGGVSVRALCALRGRATAFVGDSLQEQLFSAFVRDLRRLEEVKAKSGYAVRSIVQQPDLIVNCSRPGAILWWGCMKDIPSFQLEVSCGSNGVFKSKLAYLKQHVFAEYDMPYIFEYDVIFAWFSNHYFHAFGEGLRGPHRRLYNQDMARFLELTATHARGKVGRVTVFRESVTQHFNTPDGRWNKGKAPKGCFALRKQPNGHLVAPPTDQAFRNVMQLYHHRDIAEQENRSSAECNAMYVMPLHDAFGPMFDMHVGRPNHEVLPGATNEQDCTHYCWIPTLFHPIWERLAVILEHQYHTTGASNHRTKSHVINPSLCTTMEPPPPPSTQPPPRPNKGT